jgi:nicotinamide-nucleotide amidase
MSATRDKTIKAVSKLLLQKQLRMATAESCTGGWIAQQATRFPGSSDWFECGFVTYSNNAKQRLLGVSPATLEAHGAVSEAVVREMASGAISKSAARIAVAVSGVAGPGGGSGDKPVGLVWLAWAIQAEVKSPMRISARRFKFQGTRQGIRRLSVDAAFAGLLELLKKS